MKAYNIIVVYDKDEQHVLLCKRRKDPFQGLSNFVGGKIEPGEDGLDAAYRELQEETAITRDDIRLTHLMDFSYRLSGCYLEVYVGKLNKDVPVFGEENELYWSSLDCNFFDTAKYAGEGNMGHILEEIKFCVKELFQ